MNCGYREVRFIYADELRRVCILRDWYKNGTNEDYSNMLDMTIKENITTDDILKIATDIFEHSDLNSNDFLHVCNAVSSICHIFIEKA